jgi:hypothetical protein
MARSRRERLARDLGFTSPDIMLEFVRRDTLLTSLLVALVGRLGGSASFTKDEMVHAMTTAWWFKVDEDGASVGVLGPGEAVPVGAVSETSLWPVDIR